LNQNPEELYREGTNIIFEDPHGRVAMQLRDDRPEVHFGGYWGVFGGWVEPGEKPLETIIREMKEELSIDLDPARLLFLDVYPMHAVHARDYIYKYPVTGDLDHARLSEGQDFRFMSREELRHVHIIPHHLEMLAWYWSRTETE
jgi:8-oxo-dGTP diphosphatase